MSIGCLIPELLHEFNLEDQLYAYYYNALHLVKQANNKLGQDYVNNNGEFAHTYFQFCILLLTTYYSIQQMVYNSKICAQTIPFRKA